MHWILKCDLNGPGCACHNNLARSTLQAALRELGKKGFLKSCVRSMSCLSRQRLGFGCMQPLQTMLEVRPAHTELARSKSGPTCQYRVPWLGETYSMLWAIGKRCRR